MKRFLVFVLLAGMALNMVQAQVVLPPTDPNEACAEAWNKYHKGDVLWKTGWGLFVPGVAMIGLGTGLGIAGGFGASARPPEERTWRDYATARAGWALCGIGSGMFVASIPCLIVGQVRRKNGQELYEQESCQDLLTCEQIRNYQKKGNALWKIGWGLFGSGVGMVAIGIPLTHPRREIPHGSEAGFALVGIGSGIGVASIPCLIVGQVWRKNGEELYNAHKCVPETPLTFSIQSSANGLGLAMQF